MIHDKITAAEARKAALQGKRRELALAYVEGDAMDGKALAKLDADLAAINSELSTLKDAQKAADERARAGAAAAEAERLAGLRADLVARIGERTAAMEAFRDRLRELEMSFDALFAANDAVCTSMRELGASSFGVSAVARNEVLARLQSLLRKRDLLSKLRLQRSNDGCPPELEDYDAYLAEEHRLIAVQVAPLAAETVA